VLLITAYVLIRVSIPPDPADSGAWLEERAGTVARALSLLPLAGIAFLWFIGVLRDRMGLLEDHFLSTIVLDDGLLCLGPCPLFRRRWPVGFWSAMTSNRMR
jgi:hypothetical protein